MTSLSDRDRRILRLFGFVILPIFVLAYGARPVMSVWTDARDRRAQQDVLLDRERAAVDGAAQLAVPLEAARTALLLEERGLTRASTHQTAYSAIADHVRSLARRDHVLVQQLAELPADSLDGGLRLLRVNVRGESDLAGIGRFLRTIAADPRRIRVSRLLVERGPQNQSGGGTSASDGRNVLVMNVVIEALARIEQSPAGAR